jgi:L-malate glycosyltransferase
MRSQDPEVVIAALPNTITYALTLTRLFSRRSIRIAAIRGVNLQRSRMAVRVYANTLRTAHSVICNAPHLKIESMEMFDLNPENIQVIPNGVDIPTNTEQSSWPPTSCITIANYHPYKGHAELIRALAAMDHPLEFVFCGTGENQRQLEDLATSLGVRNQVRFVESADVDSELRRADFMVHPSTTEGLSNAILEGLAYGLPVIACNIPGNLTLIQDRINGLLVEPGSPESLRTALGLLLSDRRAFALMATEAKVAAKSFAWERTVENYENAMKRAHSVRAELT